MGGLFILAFVVLSFVAMICTIVFFIWRGKKLGITTVVLIMLSLFFLFIGMRIPEKKYGENVLSPSDYSESNANGVERGTWIGNAINTENPESIVRSIFSPEEGWIVSDEKSKVYPPKLCFWVPIGKDNNYWSDVIVEAVSIGKADEAYQQIECDQFKVEREDSLEYGYIIVSPEGRVVIYLGYLNNQTVSYLRIR